MKWRLLLLVRRAWQCLFKLWTIQQSWSLGAEGSSWSWWWGWLHQITPELISVAAASRSWFVSWLKSWCCVSAHELSWELSILSAVWGVLWSFSHLKTLVAIQGKLFTPLYQMTLLASPSNTLYLFFRGELCAVKHSAVLGIWHCFSVYTLLFFSVIAGKV